MLARSYIWIITSLLFVVPAQAKDTISWQSYHRPPGIIQHGPDQGKGFVQLVLNLVIAQLPEYNHNMPLTSLARALADIKSEKFACHPAMFKTPERQEYMYFSQAVLINPTNRLISKKGTFKDFANDGYIKFQEIAEYQDFTFALVKGRSFTKVLDKQIALYLDKNNIFPMSNTDLSPIFQMIELGRVDATIAYQFELEHYIKEYSQLPTTFDVHQLVGLSTYSSGHIACPKNEWGRKLIAKIDTVLDQIKPTEAYKYALTYWWPHERNNPEFVQYYRTEFIHH